MRPPIDARGRTPSAAPAARKAHETADHAAAQQWWADHVGVPAEGFRKASLKRHAPRRINRLNRGEDYHGYLIIVVRKSRETYWRIAAVVEATCGPEDVGGAVAR